MNANRRESKLLNHEGHEGKRSKPLPLRTQRPRRIFRKIKSQTKTREKSGGPRAKTSNHERKILDFLVCDLKNLCVLCVLCGKWFLVFWFSLACNFLGRLFE